MITTHNKKDLFERSVNSGHIQTYKNIELIIMVYCSTEGNNVWCKSKDFKYISKQLNQVSYTHNEYNKN